MNFHHLLEAVGTLAIGLLFYSYAYPRLLGPTARERGARAVVHGLAFGGLTAAMMASRIEISPGIFVDARVVPVAVVVKHGVPLTESNRACAQRTVLLPSSKLSVVWYAADSEAPKSPLGDFHETSPASRGSRLLLRSL